MNLCPYIDEAIEMPHSRENILEYGRFAERLLCHKFIFSMQFVRPFEERKRTYLPYMLCIKERYGLMQKGYEQYYKNAFTKYVSLKNNTTRTEESLELVKLLNINVDSEKTECWIDEKKINAKDFGEYIIIQTCATMQCRMWHKSKFVKMIDGILLKYKDKILLTGVPCEYDYINSIKMACKERDRIEVLCDINISTLLHYIKSAKLVITNDTGPFHFAKAFEVPTIALFGISPPQYLIRKQTKNCLVIRGDSKCGDECDIGKNTRLECKKVYKPYGDECNCINTIMVETVLKAIESLFADSQ